MGYNTSYKLEIIENNSKFPNDYIIYDLRKQSDGASYAIGDEGNTEETCKWYDCTPDMVKFSKRHPDVTLCLYGEGEEAGDIWKEYYRDGKRQRCKAVMSFPSFSENNWED